MPDVRPLLRLILEDMPAATAADLAADGPVGTEEGEVWKQIEAEGERLQGQLDYQVQQLINDWPANITMEPVSPAVRKELIYALVGSIGHLPVRNDEVAAWLKRRRDELGDVDLKTQFTQERARAIDDLLDEYRAHADTGTRLDEDTGEP